ncbi:MAG TPA: hypothetical protein VK168_08915 [Saprospiraceae bacterium]|nr:hypothetical protein [Saprospiraceae bacterium]
MEKPEFIKLLEKSHVAEIFKAEKSYFLIDQISQNAHAINNARHGHFKPLFAHLQSVLYRDVIMCLARIYDKPNNKHETLGLQYLLKKMRESANEFPSISENQHFQKELERAGMPEEIIYKLKQMKDSPESAVIEVANFFSGKAKSKELKPKITSLETLRNKKLAHNDNIEAIETTLTSKDILDLIEFAKKFIGVLGWFFNTAYSINGEYILTDDSKRDSFTLKNIFIELKIIDKTDGN